MLKGLIFLLGLSFCSPHVLSESKNDSYISFSAKYKFHELQIVSFSSHAMGLGYSLNKDLKLNDFVSLTMGGGLMLSNKLIPESGGSKFNFVLNAGVKFSFKGLVFGYKFQHFSNANLYKENPGLDGNLFYIGIER